MIQVAQRTAMFDYAELDTETRIVVQQKTGEIKERIKRSANDLIEIGERLIEIKARLGHGRFGTWLEAEFSWSDRTARNFMEVAETFKSEIISDLRLSPTTLIALSAPSVPEPARQEAVALASNGHHVTHKEAREIIDRHKPEPEPRKPIVDLFAAEDEARQAETEASEPLQDATDEPADEDDDSDAPPSRTPDQWGKLMQNFLATVVGIDRRGSFIKIAQAWPKGKVRSAKDNCTAIIEKMTQYRSELKELLK